MSDHRVHKLSTSSGQSSGQGHTHLKFTKMIKKRMRTPYRAAEVESLRDMRAWALERWKLPAFHVGRTIRECHTAAAEITHREDEYGTLLNEGGSNSPPTSGQQSTEHREAPKFVGGICVGSTATASCPWPPSRVSRAASHEWGSCVKRKSTCESTQATTVWIGSPQTTKANGNHGKLEPSRYWVVIQERTPQCQAQLPKNDP